MEQDTGKEVEIKEEEQAPEVEIEHECDYDEDGFCPTCGENYEPDDFSGGSLGNEDR